MTKKRRSKYILPNDKKEIPKIRLGLRDFEIMETIYSYRYLQTNQITSLIEGDRTSMEKRLQKLWLNRYVKRDSIFEPKKTGGSSRTIYSLRRKGAQFLAEHSGIDPDKLEYISKEKAVKERYLRHALMVSNFRAILTLALRNKKGVDIVSWQNEDKNLLKDYVEINTDHNSRQPSKQWAVIPDALFCIEDTSGTFYFFLECDRGTMTHSRFLNKMKAYWHWWREGIPYEKFGIKNFRVLTLTTTKERALNLKVTTMRADERQTGSYMFWFATEGNISLENPASILGKIWTTAASNDKTLHSILE